MLPSSDFRLALRTLVRSPGFSLVTVVLLALGIGATTTLFSLAYGVLLKPLALPEPDRLVRLQETRGGNTGRVPWTITNTTYHAWRDAPSTIEVIGGWTRAGQRTLTLGSTAEERVRVLPVTPGLLRALRARPEEGRLFADTDRGGNAGDGVALLSYGLWQRLFGGRAEALGEAVRLDNSLFTIVGVMPRDFIFPDREAEVFVPMNVPEVDPGADSIAGMIFNAVARLRPGATPEQATTEGTTRGRAAPSLRTAGLALFGSSGDIAVAAMPVREALTADVRPAVLMLLAAVGLLFTTAIASVVVLQSSRAVTRRKEMAVRAAIGASTGRLTALWLSEGAVLGALGGAAGIAAALVFHRVLPTLLPADFPRVGDVTLDLRVALFAAGLALLSSLVFGLVPAWQSRTRTLTTMLASNLAGRAGTTKTKGPRLRRVMMALQVAVACLLLVGTGLLARSFSALVSADRGFDPHNVLTIHTTTPSGPFASQAAALERAQERMRALPGVTQVALGNALPFVTNGGLSGTTLPSPTASGATIRVQTVTRAVSPEYFAAMGLRVAAGRMLTVTDTATSRPVVVVNRSFAAQYLGPTPVGTVLPVQYGSRKDWEVVGIVEDVRQGGLRGVTPSLFGGMTDPPQPEMYFSYRQWDTNVTEIAYMVRSAADALSLVPEVRTILREEAPALVVESVMTMDERVQESLARPRTYAMLVAGFAVFAAAVAVVGLFGVLSHITAQRTREIGVRTALGARPRDILELVTREAAVMTICGLTGGLALALVLARWLSALLYGVSAYDVTTYVAVSLLLLASAAGACAIPASWAARISPLAALRSDP